MSYTPNPTDPTEPLDSVDASTAAAEFRALKAYLAGGVISLPGDIIWAANNNRVGCLLCNGQAVSRTTYAALAAIASSFSYGAPYGPGDGATTFNVPDLRGRTVFGYDSGNSSGRLTGMSGGIDASHLGNVGGTQTNILVVGNLPAASITVNITDPGHYHVVTDPTHTHSQNPHSHGVTDPTHTHTSNAANQSFPSGVTISGGGGYNTAAATINAAATGISIQNATATNNASVTGLSINPANTGITATTQNLGTAVPVNNVSPGLVLMPFIKY